MPHGQAGGGAAARGNEALRAAAGAVKSDKRRGNIRDIRHKIKERAELPVCAMRHAPGALILAHREPWRRAPHFQGNTPDLAHREPWRRAPHFKVNPPSFHRKPRQRACHFQGNPLCLAHRERRRLVSTPTQSKKTADGAPKRTVCRFLIQFDSLSTI